MKRVALPSIALVALSTLALAADALQVNPTATLKVAEVKTLWKAAESNVSARLARFSPNGKRAVWALSDGRIMAYQMDSGATSVVWRASPRGSVADLAWSPESALAACVRVQDGEMVTRAVVLWDPGKEPVTLKGTDDARNVAWRADGKALAFSTKTALLHCDLASGKAEKLLDQVEGWRPRESPAYDDQVFCGNAVIARAAGTMRWTLREPGKEPVDLGECRGVAPDPERGRLYLVPWLPGPAKIPRGAGVAWVDLKGAKPERHAVVPGETGKPYWLVDIFDCLYGCTLRVSKDGKTLSFMGCQAGVLAENAWREFCIWEVPSDGSAAPTVVAKAGVIFKRYHVARDFCIGWRYSIDSACVLVDLAGGRAWRLPRDLEVQRVNTDALIGRRLLCAARGAEVVLVKLEE